MKDQQVVDIQHARDSACNLCGGLHLLSPDECALIPRYSSPERAREAAEFLAAIALAESLQK